MKYKFNTLEEVKTAIEQWFKDFGYDKPENASKQHFKVISELGEVSDEIAKEDTESLKLELGDLGVTLIGLGIMQNEWINTEPTLYNITSIDTLLFEVHKQSYEDNINKSFVWYLTLIRNLNLEALECLTLAYNKIQARLENGQLKVINGTIQK